MKKGSEEHLKNEHNESRCLGISNHEYYIAVEC